MATPAKDAFSGFDISKLNPGRFQFLVCGKTGVGKSSLINSLAGREVCNVNDPGTSASFGPGTLEVSSTSIDIKGSPVLAWDSPGLQDGLGKDAQYLQSMYEKCKDVDVVLYCIDMTTSRLTEPDKEDIRGLTQKFGFEFWKKTVLVLTKANMLDLAHKAGKHYHERLYNAFVKNITEILISEGVPRDIANQIHCVAAGFCDEEEKQRFIWYASNKTNTKNDEKVDFLPELWAVIFEVLTGKPRETFFVSSRTKKATNTAEHQVKEQQEYRKDLEQRLERERRARREQELQQQRLEQERRIQQQRFEQQRRAIQQPTPEEMIAEIFHQRGFRQRQYENSTDNGCTIL